MRDDARVIDQAGIRGAHSCEQYGYPLPTGLAQQEVEQSQGGSAKQDDGELLEEIALGHGSRSHKPIHDKKEVGRSVDSKESRVEGSNDSVSPPGRFQATRPGRHRKETDLACKTGEPGPPRKISRQESADLAGNASKRNYDLVRQKTSLGRWDAWKAIMLPNYFTSDSRKLMWTYDPGCGRRARPRPSIWRRKPG